MGSPRSGRTPEASSSGEVCPPSSRWKLKLSILANSGKTICSTSLSQGLRDAPRSCPRAAQGHPAGPRQPAGHDRPQTGQFPSSKKQKKLSLRSAHHSQGVGITTGINNPHAMNFLINIVNIISIAFEQGRFVLGWHIDAHLPKYMPSSPEIYVYNK